MASEIEPSRKQRGREDGARICGNCKFRNPEHAVCIFSIRLVICEFDAMPRGLVPETYRCPEHVLFRATQEK